MAKFMIEEYHFGSITIDGKIYNHDVEVRWTLKESLRGPTWQAGETLKWWRKESHVIDVGDGKRAMEQNPDTIIIGTGESGVARVTEEAKKFIEEKGIRLIIERTGTAVKTCNKILKEGKQKKIICLFHLTC